MEPISGLEAAAGRHFLQREKNKTPKTAEAEKKRRLSQYRLLDKQIGRLLAEEKGWRARLLQPGVQAHTDRNPAKPIERIAALRGEIDREIDKLVDLRRGIEAAIHTVPDKELQLLLHWKYIDGLGLGEIATRLQGGRRRMIRKHAAALRALPLPTSSETAQQTAV